MSMKLNHVLKAVGGSERVRGVYRQLATKFAVSYSVYCACENEKNSVFIFGSCFEGTTLSGMNADIDFVFVVNENGLLEEVRMFRDKHAKPGYVKLQVLHFGSKSDKEALIKDGHVSEDDDGRVFLMTDALKEKVNFLSTVLRVKRCSPAVTFAFSDEFHVSGTVNAVFSNHIPIFAKPWLHRVRRYKWPQQSLLDKMKEYGCLLVPISHPDSLINNEFRLSLSFQERALMVNLTPVQHKCYILLKVIKAEYLSKDCSRNSPTSYHLKTCLFYAIENTPPVFWSQVNIINCVKYCLKLLLLWVSIGHCPNYFIPLENMFDKEECRDSKIKLRENNESVIAEASDIFHALHRKLVAGAKTPCYISPGIQSVMHSFCVSMSNMRKILYSGLSVLEPLYYERVLRLFSLNGAIWSHYFSRIDDKTKEMCSSYLLGFQKFISALRTIARVTSEVGSEHVYLLIKEIEEQLNGAISFDSNTSRLLFASIKFKLNDIDKCMEVLSDTVLELATPGLQYNSNCSCYVMCSIIWVLLISLPPHSGYWRDFYNFQITNTDLFCIVPLFCVTFTDKMVWPCPFPLQYEMYRSYGCSSKGELWYNWAVVDAKVYIHFLKYCVYAKRDEKSSKKGTIKILCSVLELCKFIVHRDTGYNLLGWIYIQEGRYAEAIDCYIKSWRIRPDHNAAKWHCILLMYSFYNFIQSSKRLAITY